MSDLDRIKADYAEKVAASERRIEAIIDHAAPSPALTREALAAALPHRRSDLARRWVNLDASNGEFATFVLAALGGEPQDG